VGELVYVVFLEPSHSLNGRNLNKIIAAVSEYQPLVFYPSCTKYPNFKTYYKSYGINSVSLACG